MCSLFSWHGDVKAAARLALFPSLLAAGPAKPRHGSSNSPLQSGLRFNKLIKCIAVSHARPGRNNNERRECSVVGRLSNVVMGVETSGQKKLTKKKKHSREN